MFATNPSFEDTTLAGFGQAQGRFWQLMLLTNESPWFLVSYSVGRGADALVQSAAVAWETSLLSLIEDVGAKRVVSLRYIAPSRSHPGDWGMSAVSQVWLPTDDEVDTVGPMLFRFFDRPGLFDSFQTVATEFIPGRRKLLSLQR